MKKPAELSIITGAEAARLKNVSRQAIYQAIEDGRLQAERVGKVLLLRRADVERWEPIGHRPRKKRRGAESGSGESAARESGGRESGS